MLRVMSYRWFYSFATAFLTSERVSGFPFHVIQPKSIAIPAVVAADSTTSRTREVVLEFLERSGISMPVRFSGVDPIVKQRVREVATTWDLGNIPAKVVEKYMALGLIMATVAYRHTPIDVQVYIALYMCAGFMADDDIMPLDALREFSSRFTAGRPQLHPLLTRLIQLVVEMREHYSSYSANVITISSLEFFNAEMFARDEGSTMLRSPRSSEYIDSFRWKSGLGEAFAVLVWPRAMFPETARYIQAIPYVSKFVCLGNDLMSFYKETSAGETDNYVSQHAAIHNQSATRSLQDIADRLITLDDQVRSVLGEGPERDAWEAFSVGYIECHLYIPRYRLQELIPECY